MNTKARITSILQAETLSEKTTGFPTFDLQQLQLDESVEVKLPAPMRLGHMVERIVGELFKSSRNFTMLYENVQVVEGKKTIGELDFILQEIETQKVIHLELAYKFYLFDPNISKDFINNWIGPNRNDSLVQKLEKLRLKQFPLLKSSLFQEQFNDLDASKIQQKLCLLVSLYIPYEYKQDLGSEYKTAVKGYYMHWNQFKNLDHASVQYYIPNKKEWGIDPSENRIWLNIEEVQGQINQHILEKRSPMVWLKQEAHYEAFFVTWWG